MDVIMNASGEVVGEILDALDPSPDVFDFIGDVIGAVFDAIASHN